MSKEQTKAAFDAEAFLADYPDNAGSVRKKAAKETPSETPIKTEESKSVKSKESTASNTCKAKGSNYTPEEDAFIRDYIDARPSIGFSKETKHVGISFDHHLKISILLACCGRRNTMGGYLENVLQEHINKYGDLIDSITEKMKKK